MEARYLFSAVLALGLTSCSPENHGDTPGAFRAALSAYCVGKTTATAHNAFGSGTSLDPYRLCTAAQWVDLASTPTAWAASYSLEDDLDLGTIAGNHPAIGNDITPFSGTLNGGGHIVRNFKNVSLSQYTAPFGFVAGPTARIERIAFENVDILSDENSGGVIGWFGQGYADQVATFGTCQIGSGIYANHRGGIAGHMTPDASITNAYSTCRVFGSGGGTGGLVGHGEGLLTNCYHAYSGTITNTGGNYHGGVMGWNMLGTVANCFADTDVLGTNGPSGILVGLSNATITNSYYASNRSCSRVDGQPCETSGIGVDTATNGTYFHDSANAPMTSWDFNTVWMEVPGGYPIFRWVDRSCLTDGGCDGGNPDAGPSDAGPSDGGAPDAGLAKGGAPRAPYAVGCDCASFSGGSFAALLTAVFLARRRRV